MFPSRAHDVSHDGPLTTFIVLDVNSLLRNKPYVSSSLKEVWQELKQNLEAKTMEEFCWLIHKLMLSELSYTAENHMHKGCYHRLGLGPPASRQSTD